MPDQEAETNISSREFIKKAEFVDAEAFAGVLTEKEDKPTNQNGGSSSQNGGSSSQNTGGGNNPDEDESYGD
jgi:hypothetical protein